MKKILAALVVMSVFLVALTVMAASWSATKEQFLGGSFRVVNLTWTANGTAVTQNATMDNSTTITGDGFKMDFMGGYFLCGAETIPGSTAPTANYDFYLKDASGNDILNTAGMNRSNSTSQYASPLLDTTNIVYRCRPVRGPLKAIIGGNSVNSATGTIRLELVKP
jgi:hypothetical protein